jgi:hypothetical protein
MNARRKAVSFTPQKSMPLSGKASSSSWFFLGFAAVFFRGAFLGVLEVVVLIAMPFHPVLRCLYPADAYIAHRHRNIPLHVPAIYIPLGDMDIPFHIAADGNPALGNVYIPGVALYGHFIAGIDMDAFKIFRLDVDYFLIFRQFHPLPVHHHRAILNCNAPA